ncbi:MAG: cas7e [Bacteroidota bacterium]|nr:cas7e [Bacteroidota bacterium]
MTTFIQVHFLTSYPPSNLNRDDLGSPKTAVMGGAKRLRISSQSLKRAWRKSELFQSALTGHQGERTKRRGEEVYKQLIAGGIDERQAREWAISIAKQFGKIKKEKTENSEKQAKENFSHFHIEQLAHFSVEEKNAINDLVRKCIATKSAPIEEDLKLLRKDNSSADIACFGRMLADNPGFNFEAAVQVAHALTTHAVDIEDDYFTAVDDLNSGVEDTGAGHLGETEFASGLFYNYICISRDLLKENLGGNEDLTKRTIAALIECAAKISPTGKQSSFASRAYTSYMLVEKGVQQPRSLSVAFLKPIANRDLLIDSIKSLQKQRENMSLIYGKCADSSKYFNVLEGKGSFDDVITFSKSEIVNGIDEVAELEAVE